MTPEEIDSWLYANNHDRPWLAAQLGMSTGSIYNSFSKGFSPRALRAIEKLMNPPGAEEGGLEVVFTAREFERIEEARKLLGIATRKLYYEEAISEYTNQILEREAGDKTKPPQNLHHFPQAEQSRVAEDPPKPPRKKNGTED